MVIIPDPVYRHVEDEGAYDASRSRQEVKKTDRMRHSSSSSSSPEVAGAKRKSKRDPRDDQYYVKSSDKRKEKASKADKGFTDEKARGISREESRRDPDRERDAS